MPCYHRLGTIPRKRHLTFRRPDGALHSEELMGSHGFSGPSSLLYHLHAPTRVTATRVVAELAWEADNDASLRHRHFRAARLACPGPSPITHRVPLLYNADVAMSLARPEGCDDFFYRNGQGDELIYVHEGEGVLESPLGELPYGPGDYVIVPRGILHRHRITAGPACFLVMESAGAVRIPSRYRNAEGQLTENSPFCERDIRRPENLVVHDEAGAFRVLVKRDRRLVEQVLDHHPLDVVGWDGAYYPWALQIRDFEPRVGRVHLPPPVHQTFEGDGFVICSFVPRPFDFDPEAIPAPYYHANVMSDEVLFYASHEFMSRKGIEAGSITLHPDGLVHGPQPGMVEASMGRPCTDELAVMLDTFRPLQVSRQAVGVEDEGYWRSWTEEA